MAKLSMFSVFDSKVGAYANPFFCRTRGEAIRSFVDACKDASLPFVKHPSDYRLFYIGEFDIVSGVVSGIAPEPIVGADEIGE